MLEIVDAIAEGTGRKPAAVCLEFGIETDEDVGVKLSDYPPTLQM